MKLILFTICTLLSLCTALNQTSSARPHDPTGPKTLSRQVARYLTYPDVLQQADRAGVVVISFRIDTRQRMADIRVHSGNEALNAELIRQLLGKPIAGAGIDTQTRHTVRIRFTMND